MIVRVKHLRLVLVKLKKITSGWYQDLLSNIKKYSWCSLQFKHMFAKLRKPSIIKDQFKFFNGWFPITHKLKNSGRLKIIYIALRKRYVICSYI